MYSLVIIILTLVITPAQAQAYVGPGAGFAFLGSAFVFVLTLALGAATVAFWPIRWIANSVRRKGIPRGARTRRIVIVGLDGLEPKLVDQYMAQGLLPNFKRLAAQGSYERLGTTLPPLSPVAWSTFQTGVNPGAHNIFDFLTRDKRFCLPLLSSTRTEVSPRRSWLAFLSGGKTRASVQLLRKSQPFWKILGKYGIFSNVIRVPISYPPEKFSGNVLSAMCTPDLKGTQGSFCVYTTRKLTRQGRATGGEFKEVTVHGNVIEAFIEGPIDPWSEDGRPLQVAFQVELCPQTSEARMKVGKVTEVLKVGKFSRWLDVDFKSGRRKISAIVRFCLRELAPDFFLYMSPLNVNPSKPALPISHPIFFSTWLAKQHGPYGTLGLMEDTWGRNEFALDDRLFLEQAYLTHEERKEMFFAALQRTREGLCACVFDASDRIQHMFWRYLDPGHPSPREAVGNFERAIPDMYQKMDELVGEVLARISGDDVLLVLSDHGFTSFRRCVNLNSWLVKEGYLVLLPDAAGKNDYLQYVDWSKSRAFGIGLTGIYLNRVGRERAGIVAREQAAALKREIIEKLEGLRDPVGGNKAIRRVFDSAEVYRGAYTEEAPDLIVGTEPGYRVSWESVTGGLSPDVFEDNKKAWSGDHDVAPDAVPGILLANRRLVAKNPAIIDIAPTVLDLFKVPVPGYMEGKALL